MSNASDLDLAIIRAQLADFHGFLQANGTLGDRERAARDGDLARIMQRRLADVAQIIDLA